MEGRTRGGGRETDNAEREERKGSLLKEGWRRLRRASAVRLTNGSDVYRYHVTS